MKKLVIAVDFDGTIFREDYPEVGPILPGAKRYINQLCAQGHTIIIHTCRTADAANKAKIALKQNDIQYHYFNEQAKEILEMYPDEARKISADIYIDDRNVGGPVPWAETYRWIQMKSIGAK